MKKKSIVIMATILVLTLGASAAMAGGWGGCGMWGSGGYGPNTYATATPGQYYCPMAGSPGQYYCPMTRTANCPMAATPGQYYQPGSAAGTSSQYYPATAYSGWGCW